MKYFNSFSQLIEIKEYQSVTPVLTFDKFHKANVKMWTIGYLSAV